MDFKKVVLANENGIKTEVSQDSSVYTPTMLKGIINESKDWRQKLKNTTESQAIHGDIELSSLNANNNIPIIGSTKSATLDVKTGGITQGQIVLSLLDNLVGKDQETQVKDDLKALMYQQYYALDDMVYGNVGKYLNQGIYGLVTNPQVVHDSSSLTGIYSANTAADILEDLKEFITGYYDSINDDTSVRPINPSALNVTVKIPTVTMRVLMTKEFVNTTGNPMENKTVLEVIKYWVTKNGYKVTFEEDAGMDLITPQDGNGATYKVMMIGVFAKNYISLEIPNSPKRAGLQGSKTDWGFDIKNEIASVAYTMQVLGTQIMRANMFETRDV